MSIFKRHSIKNKVLRNLLLFLIPIAVLLIIYQIYAINLVEKQSYMSYQTNISYMAKKLDSELSNISTYMTNLYIADQNYAGLLYAKNSNEFYYAGYNLNQTLKNFTNTITTPVSVFFIREGMPAMQASVNNKFPLAQRVDITAFIEKLKTWEDSPDIPLFQYFTVKIGGNVYLAYITKQFETFMGCLIPIKSLFAAINFAPESDVLMYFSDHLGSPLTLDSQMSSLIAASSLDESNHLIIEKQKFLLISQPFTSASIALNVAVPQKMVTGSLGLLSTYIFIILILAIIFIVLLALSINHILFTPLNKLKDTILRIQNGNLETQVELTGNNDEIDEVYSTFNTMIANITQLKVQSYEIEIARQKTELQYLRLQLRPHFFINSLKVLFALAEMKKFAKIKEYVLCLSNHFRFLIYNNLEMISLEDELKHTLNYVQMQVIGAQYPIECSIEADQTTKSIMVPSLIIQTFVENSIKYALLPNRTLDIEIQATVQHFDDKSALHICVRDNGPGYPCEMLAEIQASEPEFYENHVGLGNLKRRLNLLFDDHATFYFSNLPAGGANSDIIIPIKTVPGTDPKED